MKRSENTRQGVAFVGLGDMGLPMAQNLLRAGYAVAGFDLSASRRKQLQAAGGREAKTCRDCAVGAKAAFIMVMNGRQMMEVVAGKDGLLQELAPDSVIVITATIERDEARAVAKVAADAGVHVVDAPVSGGLPGSREGRLTFMAAGAPAAIRKIRPHLRVMGKVIHIVGEEVGDGQVVKAALQALIGGLFVSIFEGMVLGRKAGIDDEVLYNVFTTSMAASPLLKNCAKLIVERRFKNTGSNIATIHKDVGISMNLAREIGVPLFATAAARELFEAGIRSFPGEDNWCVVKVLERMAGMADK